MSNYMSLAGCYDQFTEDVKYTRWADYLISLFQKYNCNVEQILDLACGTGSLSMEFSERGYEVIGTDASEEMLAVAQTKAWSSTKIPPMFLHQSMEELDLYGTVDAAVCSLDSLNYLIGYQPLEKTFKRLQYFVRPGGLFVFDVNTSDKFKALDGNVFLRENSEYFCTWSAQYSEEDRTCEFCYDIFKRKGDLWQREQETHTEFAHSTQEIKKALENSKFELIDMYGELSYEAPAENEKRIFYVAKRIDD